MAGDVLVGALAFAGGLLGSVLAYAASRAALRQEGSARSREEWGRRFTAALEAVTSSDVRSRAAGRALLVELMRSDQATEEDRREAAAVLESTATQLAGPTRLLLVSPDDLKDVEILEDTGTSSLEKGDDQ